MRSLYILILVSSLAACGSKAPEAGEGRSKSGAGIVHTTEGLDTLTKPKWKIEAKGGVFVLWAPMGSGRSGEAGAAMKSVGRKNLRDGS